MVLKHVNERISEIKSSSHSRELFHALTCTSQMFVLTEKNKNRDWRAFLSLYPRKENVSNANFRKSFHRNIDRRTSDDERVEFSCGFEKLRQDSTLFLWELVNKRYSIDALVKSFSDKIVRNLWLSQLTASSPQIHPWVYDLSEKEVLTDSDWAVWWGSYKHHHNAVSVCKSLCKADAACNAEDNSIRNWPSTGWIMVEFRMFFLPVPSDNRQRDIHGHRWRQ